MKRLATIAIALVFAGLADVAQAADKNDPTGTWKWSVTINDQVRETTLKLKLDGDKLTGAVVGRNNQETPIESATFKDGDVSFSTVREIDGQKFTVKYSGKVDGDSIKGKAESNRGGQTRTRDWEAKRQGA